MGLSTSDALSLNLLERFLRPLLPGTMTRQLEPMFALAASKLAAQRDSNDIGRWASKVAAVDASLPVVPPPIDRATLQVVQDALLADEQVEIEYVKSGGRRPTTQTLHPLGLVQCGSITYLVATAFRSPKQRLYAMHRARTAKRLYEPATIPTGFSLQGFIDKGGLQFGDAEPVRLNAWVSTKLGEQLADTRLSVNQRLEPAANGFVLTVALPYSWRLRWWILSKTGSIEVISPRYVRADIEGLLANAVARYQNYQSGTMGAD
jgi:predicted DNA-binding transcriptional regulator YafY